MLINAALWEQAPYAGRPCRVTVRLSYRSSNPDALIPPSEEAPVLERFEANLLGRFRFLHEARLIARLTFSNARHFIFYGPDLAIKDARITLTEVIKAYPRYHPDIEIESDPGWSRYVDLINQGIPFDRLVMND